MGFETTRWSLVLAAGGDDSRAAHAALAALCEAYWYPIYAYVRRRGANADDARDLTQGFLTSLLERHDLRHVSQDRGRFRTFLLTSLHHFLANDYARRRTQKRGGHAITLSFEFAEAEGHYRGEPVEVTTPETLYERRWALTVIDRVMKDLRAEWRAAGEEAKFEALKACLLGQAPPGGYAAVAADLGSSEGAVKVAIHRLKKDFHVRLRETIAETVSTVDEVDDEIRHLIQALDA